MAISGDAALLVHQLGQDRVVRVNPRAAAASVMFKPKGSMHWRNTKPPGWGGFFIGMTQAPVSGNPHNRRRNTARVVVYMEAVQSSVANRTDHLAP